MAGRKKPSTAHDLSDQIVLKAIHDKSGWRVQMHLHEAGACTILEGHARFPDESSCHEHGRALHEVIDTVIGILKPKAVPRGSPNSN